MAVNKKNPYGPSSGIMGGRPAPSRTPSKRPTPDKSGLNGKMPTRTAKKARPTYKRMG
jgi:hypothetical protein